MQVSDVGSHGLFFLAGAKRTAGGGCWIKISKCPKHVYQQLSFYDAWAASNLHAGILFWFANKIERKYNNWLMSFGTLLVVRAVNTVQSLACSPEQSMKPEASKIEK